MVRAFLLAALAGGLLSLPAGVAARDDKKDGKKEPPAPPAARAAAFGDRILSILHQQRVSYEKDLRDTPLFELLQDLSKRYDLTFVIRDRAFRDAGVGNIRDAKADLTATRLDGLTLHRFLTLVLTSVDAVCLVRNDHIEITTRHAALKEAGLLEGVETAAAADDPSAPARAEARLNLPLVSIAANGPLAGVLGELARVYDLNVVIDAQIPKDARAVVVRERLLNVPADTALELLAGQAGLTVERKGNAFRVTPPSGQ